MTALESYIDAVFEPYAGSAPGAGVAVLGGGHDVRRAYGLANLESRVPASLASNYRLASLSKQFTAAAVLLLAEKGALSLDDPLRRWLPSMPAAAEAMTLRHLLTHTSGLIDFEEVMSEDGDAPVRDADVLRLLEPQDGRHFEPGSRYRYSNSAYVLLSLVVERASGSSYASFLRERLLLPLGMRHSVAHEAAISVIAHRAFGYTRRGDQWMRTDQSRTSATLGDGGIYSSIDDLARWDEALEPGRLLAASSLREAFAPAVATQDRAVFYGLGWRVSAAAGGSRVVWHTGESVGFRHVILRYLAPRLTVIVLTNRTAPAPFGLAVQLARRCLGTEAELSVEDEAAGPDPAARPLLNPAAVDR